MEFTSLFLLSVFFLGAKSYQIYYLEDANVCSSAKRTIRMNSKTTALLIQLSKYPHVTDLAIDCHLEIEAPKNQGLQVVIEDINLRRNTLDNECDDYVWFGRDDDGSLSSRLCGERKLVPINNYSSRERSLDTRGDESRDSYVESLIPDGPEATTFYDPGGELHIWFRKTSRKVDHHSQPLRLKVVVTAYRQTCKMNDTLYYGCSQIDKTSKMQEKCIPAGLRCDGHVNCGEGLHTDESGCAVGTSVTSNAISTASLVILGAVAMLLICLMASMVCFCRRRKARLRRARNAGECQVVSTLPIPHHTGEVVPLDRWRTPVADEVPSMKSIEDPPPSYSELFPEYAAVPQQSTDSN